MLAASHDSFDTDSAAAVRWQPASRARWESLFREAGKSSLEQSWAYGEAAAAQHGQQIERHVLSAGGRPVALLQAFRRRYLAVGVTRIVRGPVWLSDPLDAPETAAICRSIAERYRKRRLDFLLWLPELPDDPRSTALMAAQGLRRVVTGYSSIWLDLRQSPEALLTGMNPKWRNAVGRGQRKGLEASEDRKERQRQAALVLYDAFRRKRRFVGTPGDFIAAIATADSNAVLSLTARHDGKLAAGVILVRHGASATYLASWSSETGHTAQAHNLLLWRGIECLQADGIQWLDLGGVNTESQQGLARFKLGLGGAVFTLTGSYL